MAGLWLSGPWAVVRVPGELLLTRVGSADVLARWATAPGAPAIDDPGDAETAGPDEDDPDATLPDDEEGEPFEGAVTAFVLDPRAPRLALLRQTGRIDADGEVRPIPFRSEIDLVDPASLRSMRVCRAAAQIHALLGFAPNGKLMAYGEATGLAGFHAFVSTRENQLDQLLPSPHHPFSWFAGELAFALGLHALPHVERLVFEDDGARALSGSCSQYRAHLARVELFDAPEVLQRESIEALEIRALPGFREAIVLESGPWGTLRLAVWSVAPLERVRDLLVLPEGETRIRRFDLDAAGKHAFVVLTDGNAAVVDVASGDLKRLQAVCDPAERDRADALAVDFEGRRFAVVRGGRDVEIRDFDGDVIASCSWAGAVKRAVHVHRGAFVVIADDEATVLARAGGRHVWTAPAPIIGSAVGDEGVMVADSRGRIHVVGSV